eukprot:SAG31_NODE_8294_length_1479_cov_1.681159_2_plen_51_part_00
MWSEELQSLFWVDCSGKHIHRFDPEAGGVAQDSNSEPLTISCSCFIHERP